MNLEVSEHFFGQNVEKTLSFVDSVIVEVTERDAQDQTITRMTR